MFTTIFRLHSVRNSYFLQAYDSNRSYAIGVGVCSNAGYGITDSWLPVEENSVNSKQNLTRNKDEHESDIQRAKLLDQYVAEGAWPIRNKAVEVPHEGSEHVGVDHSLISPRKVDDTEDNTPVLSMGLGMFKLRHTSKALNIDIR